MKQPSQPVVVFDGVCNLCNAFVQFILRHDRSRRLLLCASQSDAGQRLLGDFPAAPSSGSTVLLVEDGRIYARSTAALRIVRHLGLPWSLAVVFMLVPRFLRDAVYEAVARNRYRWFGRREVCRVAQPGELERFLS